MIEARHCGEVAGIDIRCVAAGNQGVGVGRIADDEHFDVAIGVVVHGFALNGEYCSIRFKQILAFHARTARSRTDEQRIVTVFESDIRVISRYDSGEGREGAIVEFHNNALQGWQRRGDLEKLQNDRLIGAEHLARGDTKCELIANLASSAGNGDANGCFHR